MKRLNIIIIVVLLALMLAGEYLPSLLRAKPTPTAVGQPKVIHFGGADSFAYNPATVTINAGGQVTWQGNFGEHPLASDTQVWYPHREGDTFSYTFKRPGTYRFYCENHGAPNGAGMSGVVIVQ